MEECTNRFSQHATNDCEVRDPQKDRIRVLLNLFYDIQKERIAVGNRIISYFRLAMGLNPKVLASDEDEEKDELLDSALAEYYRIREEYENVQLRSGVTPRVSTILQRVSNRSYILSETEWTLCDLYRSIFNSETQLCKRIEKEVMKHPMWDAFFKDVRGCGALMAAVCLAYFDPYKARHCSSFWKYAGLDTVHTVDKNGKHVVQGRNKSHTEMRSYIDKNGKEAQKVSITYEPFVKTKLIGVLGSSFIKLGGKYRNIYDGYKDRLSQEREDLTPSHRHNMAVRYMIKMFLRDMWVAWRTLEGLPISEPYEVAYLGKKPHGFNY